MIAQGRDVVPLSSWISDAVSTHAARGMAFQLLTPHTSRLTHAVRTLMAGPMAWWVVRAEDGSHFDGITGLPLAWDPEYAYVPQPDERGSVAPPEGYLDDAPVGTRLLLDQMAHLRAAIPG